MVIDPHCLARHSAKDLYEAKSVEANEENDFYRASLDEYQEKRKSEILHQNIHLGDGLETSVFDICAYIERFLAERNCFVESSFLIGGAAANVLAGHFYADIDIAFYFSNQSQEAKSLECALDAVIGFVSQRRQGNSASVDKKTLEKAYITKKKLIKTEDELCSLVAVANRLEFKFICKKQRQNVSSADGFQVCIFQDYVRAVNGGGYCGRMEYEQSLYDLKNRYFNVIEPQNVQNLLFRLLHKQNQGFRIENLDLFDTAFQKFEKEHPLNNSYGLKIALDNHWKNHYAESLLGKAVDFLNLSYFLAGKDKAITASGYLKTIANIWYPGKENLLDFFSKTLKARPELAKNLFNILHGAFFYQWALASKKIIPITTTSSLVEKNGRFLGFSFLENQERSHTLQVNRQLDECLIDFFDSWELLGQTFDNETHALQGLLKSAEYLGIEKIFHEKDKEQVAKVLVQAVWPDAGHCKRFFAYLAEETRGFSDTYWFKQLKFKFLLGELFSDYEKLQAKEAAEIVKTTNGFFALNSAKEIAALLKKYGKLLEKLQALSVFQKDLNLCRHLRESMLFLFEHFAKTADKKVFQRVQEVLKEGVAAGLFSEKDQKIWLLTKLKHFEFLSKCSDEADLSNIFHHMLDEIITLKICLDPLENQVLQNIYQLIFLLNRKQANRISAALALLLESGHANRLNPVFLDACAAHFDKTIEVGNAADWKQAADFAKQLIKQMPESATIYGSRLYAFAASLHKSAAYELVSLQIIALLGKASEDIACKTACTRFLLEELLKCLEDLSNLKNCREKLIGMAGALAIIGAKEHQKIFNEVTQKALDQDFNGPLCSFAADCLFMLYAIEPELCISTFERIKRVSKMQELSPFQGLILNVIQREHQAGNYKHALDLWEAEKNFLQEISEHHFFEKVQLHFLLILEDFENKALVDDLLQCLSCRHRRMSEVESDFLSKKIFDFVMKGLASSRQAAGISEVIVFRILKEDIKKYFSGKKNLTRMVYAVIEYHLSQIKPAETDQSIQSLMLKLIDEAISSEVIDGKNIDKHEKETLYKAFSWLIRSSPAAGLRNVLEGLKKMSLENVFSEDKEMFYSLIERCLEEQAASVYPIACEAIQHLAKACLFEERLKILCFKTIKSYSQTWKKQGRVEDILALLASFTKAIESEGLDRNSWLGAVVEELLSFESNKLYPFIWDLLKSHAANNPHAMRLSRKLIESLIQERSAKSLMLATEIYASSNFHDINCLATLLSAFKQSGDERFLPFVKQHLLAALEQERGKHPTCASFPNPCKSESVNILSLDAIGLIYEELFVFLQKVAQKTVSPTVQKQCLEILDAQWERGVKKIQIVLAAAHSDIIQKIGSLYLESLMMEKTERNCHLACQLVIDGFVCSIKDSSKLIIKALSQFALDSSEPNLHVLLAVFLKHLIQMRVFKATDPDAFIIFDVFDRMYQSKESQVTQFVAVLAERYFAIEQSPYLEKGMHIKHVISTQTENRVCAIFEQMINKRAPFALNNKVLWPPIATYLKTSKNLRHCQSLAFKKHCQLMKEYEIKDDESLETACQELLDQSMIYSIEGPEKYREYAFMIGEMICEKFPSKAALCLNLIHEGKELNVYKSGMNSQELSLLKKLDALVLNQTQSLEAFDKIIKKLNELFYEGLGQIVKEDKYEKISKYFTCMESFQKQLSEAEEIAAFNAKVELDRITIVIWPALISGVKDLIDKEKKDRGFANNETTVISLLKEGMVAALTQKLFFFDLHLDRKHAKAIVLRAISFVQKNELLGISLSEKSGYLKELLQKHHEVIGIKLKELSL